MNKITQKLADIAIAQVGIKEEGGNNKGASIVLYQQATWLKPDAWPWCAAFVCWCVKEWLKLPEVKTSLNFTDENIKTWRPRTAGAWDFLKWAKDNRLTILTENDLAKAGDIVVFDFSHIGIVVQDQLKEETTIHTVEGNTNNAGTRDSSSGDGVFRKERKKEIVKNYIRILKE